MSTTETTGAKAIPLSREECQAWDNIAWAERNEEVRRHYPGQWIALHDRVVIAHGEDRDLVERQAIVLTGHGSDQLALWLVVDPSVMIRDNPPSAHES